MARFGGFGMNEEDEAFEELAKKQGDWGGWRKKQIIAASGWIGLTTNEIDGLAVKFVGYPKVLCKAIELKLKQKNGFLD